MKQNEPTSSESVAPVASPLPTTRHRQCTGAQLGNKRAEVERMLLEGEPKLKIARALKISAHSVRAVARQMGAEDYAAPSREVSEAANGDRPRQSLPDTLKAKAMQAVGAITEDKLTKASPQACAIVADRLLGRADAMEKHGHDLEFMNQLANTYGIGQSHSVSRVTLTKQVTVETQRTEPTDVEA